MLSPNYFFVTACAISAIVAASIASSWTVVGTIGVGFMVIAASMCLDTAIAAAALGMIRILVFILLCTGIEIIWTGWVELNGMA